ncbi:cobalamin biosynthesis protein [Ferrimonas balearica]|uniref:cobalamin biosynthesis protein CobD/CbiB n=1 Tax=Ferrimonas balearica TaxID=44012 RepID=UPI001C996E8C|nr:cobalamin biosynthesis protein [Ferrimonas balearica]MBY5993571.1 cobalamin biosynthesis protein [Ferrimonas balearica]
MDAALGPYSALLAPPLVLALAYLLSMLVPEAWRPRYRLAPLAESLARKTNKPQHTPQQRRLAGVLSLGLLALPLLSAVALITGLAAYALPFELALLAWLLPGPALAKDNEALAARLLAGQKEQARSLLAPWTVRDTYSLSPMGLTKAAIEAQLQQERSQRFAVLFWYVLGGPLMATAAWLSNELVRVWHRDRPGMGCFAHWPTRVAGVLMLPVNALLAATLALYGAPLAPWRARHQLSGDWEARSHQWPQLSLAWSLGSQLGGPWQLEGQRRIRPRLGPDTPPAQPDLLRTRRLLSYACWLWLSLLFLFGAALAMLRHGAL